MYVEVYTWRSLAGFQSMSYRTSLEAPTRFRPTPPALELRRNTAAKHHSYYARTHHAPLSKYHLVVTLSEPLLSNTAINDSATTANTHLKDSMVLFHKAILELQLLKVFVKVWELWCSDPVV